MARISWRTEPQPHKTLRLARVAARCLRDLGPRVVRGFSGAHRGGMVRVLGRQSPASALCPQMVMMSDRQCSDSTL